MTRISLAVGIFKALNICFEETLADQWVTLKNRGLLFAGHAPINFMIERGPAGMKTVRRRLDVRDAAIIVVEIDRRRSDGTMVL